VPPNFDEIYSSDKFQALDTQQRSEVRDYYFKTHVEPKAKEKGVDVGMAKSHWDDKYNVSPALMGEAGKALRKTHKQLSKKLFDVDRKTGVRHFSFRSDLGKRDTLEEKVDFLNDILGEKGWVTGNQHTPSTPDFALTRQGMERLEMADVWDQRTGKDKNKNIAIDELGASFGDVADMSQELLPMAGAIGAGFFTGGLGVIPAMGIAGLTGGGLRAVEETGEHLRGENKQSFMDVAGDVGRTGLLEATGEGVGRGVSMLARRFLGPNVMRLKESGPGQFLKSMLGKRPEPKSMVDPTRIKRVEEMLKEGYAPLIHEATGRNPVLGIGQGMANYVSGGSPAIKQNLSALNRAKDKLVKEAGSGQVPSEGLGKGIVKDIQQTVGAQERALSQARKESTSSLSRMVQGIRSGLGKVAGKGDVSTAIQKEYNAFQEIGEQHYGLVDTLLGKMAKKPVVDISGVHEMLEGMMEKRIGSAPGDPGVGLIKSILDGDNFITMKQAMFNAQRFKTAGFHDAMKGDFSQHEFREIGKALEESIAGAGDQIRNMKGQITKFSDRKTLGEASNAYDQAVGYYRDNAWKFDDALVGKITNQLKTEVGAGGEKIVIDNMSKLVSAMDTAGEGSIKKLYAAMGDDTLVSALKNEFFDRRILKGTGSVGRPIAAGSEFTEEGSKKFYQNIKNINEADPQRLSNVFGKQMSKRMENAALDAEIYGRGATDIGSATGAPLKRMEKIARESKRLDDLKKNEFVRLVEGGNPTTVAAKFEDLAGNIFEPTAYNASILKDMQSLFGDTTSGMKLYDEMMATAMHRLLAKTIKPGRNIGDLIAEPKFLDGVVTKYKAALPPGKLNTMDNPIVAAFSRGGDLKRGQRMWADLVELSEKTKTIGDKTVSSLVAHGFMFSPLKNLSKIAGIKALAKLFARPDFINYMVKGSKHVTKSRRVKADAYMRTVIQGISAIINDTIGDANIGESLEKVYK
jgi:hypothetical protein